MGTVTMYCKLLTGALLLCATLPFLVQADTFPNGTLKTDCLERIFWIWVDQGFFGSTPWQLEALTDHGYIDIMQQARAAQCGYTITNDVYGNVEIRISFLGCWIKNTNDQKFDIMVQFRVNASGHSTVYPLSMSCSPSNPWNVREIICEENYMEVSVTRLISSDLLKNLFTSNPVEDIFRNWQVWFLDSSPVPITAKEAISKGYGVNATLTRVMVRAPYNTSEAQIFVTGKFHLILIASNMLYRQTLLRLIVDTTIACPSDPPVFTETALSWLTPAVLGPLLVANITNSQFAMGVDARLLNSAQIKENSYIFYNDKTTVNVTVPYGAPGGYMESDVVNGSYMTTYTIHLVLQRQWLGTNEDDSTTHTAYTQITAPVKGIPLNFLDHTVKEKRYFNVSLGNFYPNVALKSFVIYQVPLALTDLAPRQMSTTRVTNPNNTNVFYLTVPFTDPVVEQQYLGGYMREYTLYVTYILTLTAKNKDFSYTDVVSCVLEDVVPPSFEGECSSNSLIINMKRGNIDFYWIPYIRNLPLDKALIASQNITVKNSAKSFYLEVPSSAVGLVYEVATLDGFRVSLDLHLHDNKTLEVMESFSVNCTFPPVSPVCLSNGSMIVVVDSSVTKPSFDARKTHLKDPTCTPLEATVNRALFNFAAYQCGTTRQFYSDYLVYENEVTIDRQLLLPGQPIITRDSTYRLTVRCRYPIRDTQWLGIVYNTASALHGLSDIKPKALLRRARTTLADLRVAKDNTFTSFYQPADYPVSVQPADDLHFQVVVQSPAYMSKLQDCWATTYHGENRITRWDLIVDGHAAVAEAFSTEVQTLLGLSPRFLVTPVGAQDVQLYVHCKVLLCDAGLQMESCCQTCNQTEQGIGKRTFPMLSEMVSVGPIRVAAQNGVINQHVGMDSQSTWSWFLALGLAVIAALTVGAIVLTIRLFVK
ncbi:uncharacterized protein LOC134935953 isoform X2 [Pseudophryne corroboree]|uniref:uncharacterized protein LOC134935953 isoform X2 n=1 Tax=Pseudophryne corroboree TaxID=495146 RepID=UPI0030817F9B